MRKILSFITLSVLILFPGCNYLFAPKHLKDSEFKAWVLRNTSYAFDENIADNFINKVRTRKIKVKGFETIGTFEDYVLEYFNGHSSVWGVNNLQEYLDKFEEEDFDTSIWNSDRENALRAVCKSNPSRASSLLKSLRESYFYEYERVAKKELTVLNWMIDEDSIGDKYTGYLVEYEIGEGYYVLVSLIEYDDSDRYTAKIIYQGNSLREMNNCYR